jgi:hypothetical protein
MFGFTSWAASAASPSSIESHHAYAASVGAPSPVCSEESLLAHIKRSRAAAAPVVAVPPRAAPVAVPFGARSLARSPSSRALLPSRGSGVPARGSDLVPPRPSPPVAVPLALGRAEPVSVDGARGSALGARCARLRHAPLVPLLCRVVPSRGCFPPHV